MGLLLLVRKNLITGSRIVVEEGNFLREDGGVGDQRLLCETHGDSWAYVTYNGSAFYVPKSERLVLIRRPWRWCGGCAVIYGEQRPPSNWFYESLR